MWTRQSVKINDRLPPRIGDEYKRIKQDDMQKVWQRNGTRLHKKREWCLRKAGIAKNTYHEGIPVRDIELEIRFGN